MNNECRASFVKTSDPWGRGALRGRRVGSAGETLVSIAAGIRAYGRLLRRFAAREQNTRG